LGILERKEREKEYRRKTIINAAEYVFFNKGFESATMQDIADKSELSKGTLYLYFKTKNELCLAIYLRSLEIISANLKKLQNQKLDAIEIIINIPKEFFKFIELNPAHYMAILNYRQHGTLCTEDSDILQACKLQNENISSTLRDIIDKGKEDGLILETVKSDHIANLIWNNRTGLLSNSILINIEISDDTKNMGKDTILYFFEILINAIKSK